jgi:hypothetical protein
MRGGRPAISALPLTLLTVDTNDSGYVTELTKIFTKKTKQNFLATGIIGGKSKFDHNSY